MKSVIFDLGGVLADIDLQGMVDKLHQLGFKEDPDNTHSIYQVGKISTGDFISKLLSLCAPETKREELINVWNSCILTIPVKRLLKIKELRKRGYQTYLLSNTNELHWQYVVDKYFSADGFTLKDLFDDVFLSQEVHLAKPSAEIYRFVLNKIGSDGKDCLFIDDLQENVTAANREGLTAVWLDLENNNLSDLLDSSLSEN